MIFQEGIKHKKNANDYFRKNKYRDAVNEYTKVKYINNIINKK
jgi:hypothetical protein